MKVFVVCALNNFDPQRHRANYFQHELFHGLAEYHPPYESRGCLGDSVAEPMSLSRSGRWVPAVFAPRAGLVVTEVVRAKLEGLPHVEFRPVRYERLFDFPYYPAGDTSYEQDPRYKKTLNRAGDSKLLERGKNVPAFHGLLPSCFELVVARLSDIIPQYTGLESIHCELPDCVVKEEDFMLSPAMMMDYPIVWWSGTLFREDVFQRIEDHIDRDFFAVVDLEI
jgi:hypothetical protein